MSRYTISSVRWGGTSFPWGTLWVNGVGCFLAGWAFAAGVQRGGLFLMTGFLGALTTFSTYALEALQSLLERRYSVAFVSAAPNNVGGLALAALGMWLSRF